MVLDGNEDERVVEELEVAAPVVPISKLFPSAMVLFEIVVTASVSAGDVSQRVVSGETVSDGDRTTSVVSVSTLSVDTQIAIPK